MLLLRARHWNDGRHHALTQPCDCFRFWTPLSDNARRRARPPPLPLQLRVVQQWRWGLLRALHQDPASAAPAALAQHYEQLLFGWMRLRKAVGTLLAAVADAGGEPSGGAWADARQRWAAAAEQLDGAAGIAPGAAPPKPLLWKAGGRPLLPRSLGLSEALAQLLALCEATRCALRLAAWC